MPRLKNFLSESRYCRGATPPGGSGVRGLGKSGVREGEAVLSSITRAEVLCGGTEEESRIAAELCDGFECLPLTGEDSNKAAELRRKNGWKFPDAFQAAAALRWGLKLVTRDARGFDEKKHPFVLIPYRLK